MTLRVLLPIFFPIIFGSFLVMARPKDSVKRNLYVLLIAIVNTLFSVMALYSCRNIPIEVISFSKELSIAFCIDSMSLVFASIVTALWVPATLYAIEYMHHEGYRNTFFTFFTMTYGVVLGVAFAGNLLTMYLFYELLTLSTFPLVMHGLSPKALAAGKRYLTFSIAGASFGFIAMMILLAVGVPFNFVYGGNATAFVEESYRNLVLYAYIFAFFGFGVKGGIFPFHIWLPSAGVAPTPVTALLHAVAVVNAGVFAVIRTTYYSFGAEFLKGTFAQSVTMTFAAIGIVFGSVMALRATHLKLRLAYSTVSNLSYMLFSASLLSKEGLMGAVAHMSFHSILKITLFFLAGALLYVCNKEYVMEVDGLGRKMPIAFGCFTICSLGLMGIPPLIGFTSKWIIGTAAVENGSLISYLGAFALIISALLTALYLFSIIIPAFFPGKDFDFNTIKDIKDPGPLMSVPMIIMTAASLFIALNPSWLLRIFEVVAMGGSL